MRCCQPLLPHASSFACSKGYLVQSRLCWSASVQNNLSRIADTADLLAAMCDSDDRPQTPLVWGDQSRSGDALAVQHKLCFVCLLPTIMVPIELSAYHEPNAGQTTIGQTVMGDDHAGQGQ